MSENGNFPSRCRTDYFINIFKTPSPSKSEIVDIIKRSAPVDWLKMQESIAMITVDTSLSEIKNLLYSSENFVYEEPVLPANTETSVS